MKRFSLALVACVILLFGPFVAFAQGTDPLITTVNVEEAERGVSPSALNVGSSDIKDSPVGDALCWTESACQTHIESDGKSFSPELFELNPSACGSSNLGYCYPPVFEYRLLIPFGQITSVRGIGGYVQALFSLVMVLAAIGTVLTVMIAGLKWMVARGDAGAVQNARQMVSRALGSIVILLVVISLANLVDPSLKILAPLRTPLMKKADFISPGTSCEEMAELGYTISVTQGTCGEKGTITALPAVEETRALVSTVEVGDECVFAKCNVQNLETCTQVAGQYKCVRCGNVYAAPGALTSADLVPSSGVCESLTLRRTFATFPETTEIKCIYFDAPGIYSNACIEVFYPDSSAPGVDCARLQDKYGHLGCGMYDYVSVRADGIIGYSYSAAATGSTWLANLEGANGFDAFNAVCGGNICKLPLTCRTRWENGSWAGGDGVLYNTAQCVDANAPPPAPSVPTSTPPPTPRDYGPRY